MTAVRALAGRLPAPRTAALRRLRDAAGEILDEALVLIFPEGGSFTGEAVAELHLHGSRRPSSPRCCERSAIEPGLRLAEPGEFTRRALENEPPRPGPGRRRWPT